MPEITIESPAAIAVPGIVAGALAIIFALVLRSQLLAKAKGSDVDLPVLDKLAAQIASGSRAFLKIEYRWLSVFVAFVFVVLIILFTVDPLDKNADDKETDGIRVACAFLLGALLSGMAGYLGMDIATEGNVRTTVACNKGTLNDGLQTAFKAGAVMGFYVVGWGLLGLSTMFWLQTLGDRSEMISLEIMAGFGVGASSIALFARVAGGIYTKAADVGADLVGKVEAGINEDDPHNPAVIADNVGDNVGDVAGMGADLFESYVGSIIACGTLGGADKQKIALPILISAFGIVCSIIGTFMVRTDQEGRGWDVKLSTLMKALNRGMYTAATLFVACAFVICYMLFELEANDHEGLKLFGCIVIGLVSGVCIGHVTEYFTSFDYGPVISIKDRGSTGPATVVIQGIGVGMISCFPPTLILVATVLGCNALAGVYGVSIAAVGMLATLGITLATDAYGPVADNAGGLAEMAGLGEETRNKTDSLDALGNTTAATGKGFAIGSAVLTALSLLAAFKQKVIIAKGAPMTFDISDPEVMSGVLFGAMLPYLFAAMTMISVGKAAAEIIQEVRRQFREIPGLRQAIERASRGEKIPKEEDVDPDSDKCVEISTNSSVKEMIAPGAYAILSPLVIGFLVGPRCLMGALAGCVSSGAMVAIMMSNAGGAWDNSKKLCEKLKLKKTEQGNACVIGDTVGDPFKDTSGPALNILLKLMSMVSLLIAPLLKNADEWNQWYYAMIPLALIIGITGLLMHKGIITWKDPLSSFEEGKKSIDATAPEVDAKLDTVKPADEVKNLLNGAHNAAPEKKIEEATAEPTQV